MQVQIDVLEATILGTVQGLTEFLPISSRAHLILIPWLFGWPDPGLTFDVALHLGTLIALLLYFFRDWVALAISALKLLNGNTRDTGARIALYIILATIPAGIAGFFLERYADQFSTPTVIATTLIGVALLMRAAELSGMRKTELEDITLADSLTVGFAQALAIIPGVSRSGVTITAGLFRNMTRSAAAQFSFLLSAPIVAGAVVKKVIDISKEGFPSGQEWPFTVGIIVSAAFGLLSIAALMHYLQTRSTFIFIYYRIALGIAVLILGYFWGLSSNYREVTIVQRTPAIHGAFLTAPPRSRIAPH
jgi:undecaprenyl-diphosphatase